MNRKVKKGKILWNIHWNLSRHGVAAMERLAELGVSITGKELPHENVYVLHVPLDLKSPVYMEVGYLLAQLSDERFPDGFAYSRGISGIPSAIIADQDTAQNPIRFDLDSDCYRFEVRAKG
jgi:hypothetical protein